jgi:hypothetical protein
VFDFKTSRFVLTSDEAIELATEILKQASIAAQLQRSASNDYSERLKGASLSSTGIITSLDITRNNDVEQPSYIVEYFNDDDPDERVSIAKIEDYDVEFSPIPAMQGSQLRALVGGQHQFTTSIKVTPINFSFKDLKFNPHPHGGRHCINDWLDK